jgi:hypothetical protein
MLTFLFSDCFPCCVFKCLAELYQNPLASMTRKDASRSKFTKLESGFISIESARLMIV